MRETLHVRNLALEVGDFGLQLGRLPHDALEADLHVADTAGHNAADQLIGLQLEGRRVFGDVVVEQRLKGLKVAMVLLVLMELAAAAVQEDLCPTLPIPATPEAMQAQLTLTAFQ